MMNTSKELPLLATAEQNFSGSAAEAIPVKALNAHLRLVILTRNKNKQFLKQAQEEISTFSVKHAQEKITTFPEQAQEKISD
jgi:hypothetical protein